ncbi:MAG: hypothetical protein MUP55_00360 [Candidatus Aenigmarchaeota archaeon]|nr:hypothetical protein [Candidatus Aenigmarchaeota archaeon]
MKRLQKSLIKMEYKSRRLFEENKGYPPLGTIVEYNRIMEVDGKNLQEFKKELERFYPVPL